MYFSYVVPIYFAYTAYVFFLFLRFIFRRCQQSFMWFKNDVGAKSSIYSSDRVQILIWSDCRVVDHSKMGTRSYSFNIIYDNMDAVFYMGYSLVNKY